MIVIENKEYERIIAKESDGDVCKLCGFYGVVMTPFRTRNICTRPSTISCESPVSVYFKSAMEHKSRGE